MAFAHLPIAIPSRHLPSKVAGVLGGLLLLGGAVVTGAALWPRQAWSPQEVASLRSLSLASLGPVPADPSNGVADNPRAAALGQALLFDTRFSANGQVACATCHQPDRRLTDDLPLAHGVGRRSTRRTLANRAWWLTQMMPIVKKLTTYAYEGHSANNAGPSRQPRRAARAARAQAGSPRSKTRRR